MKRIRDDIDFEQLKKLCEIQCTMEETAGVIGVNVKTLAEYINDMTSLTWRGFCQKYGADGRAALRRAQFKAALEDRNPAMLIWLGKQMLGQKEKVDIDLGSDPSRALADQIEELRIEVVEGKQANADKQATN